TGGSLPALTRSASIGDSPNLAGRFASGKAVAPSTLPINCAPSFASGLPAAAAGLAASAGFAASAGLAAAAGASVGFAAAAGAAGAVVAAGAAGLGASVGLASTGFVSAG